MGDAVIDKVPRAALEAVRYALQSGSFPAAMAALKDVAPPRTPRDLKDHLEETVHWIFRAHDACEKGGVSRSYSLRQHRRYQCTGWLPPYPETTGYIIPTLFEVADVFDWPEARERAERMARWEVDVQMDSGAVRGGTTADEPSPAVFNTGQVLFGWVRAAEVTGDALFDEAARKASAFLVDAQDEDGAWRRGASKFAMKGGHVYNARAAWGLACYGRRADDEKALQAACRSADYALSQQNDCGWFDDNCLTDPERPLVHTIAYAAQGVLEIGLLVNQDKYVDAARKTAEAMLPVQREDGFLAGRFDSDWNAGSSWSCLTGNAQMALVWSRLADIDDREDFRQAAQRAVQFVLSTQRLESTDLGVRGGVAGSYPIWGDYGPYEYLNWAAKFLTDALLTLYTKRPSGTHG